MVQDCCKRPQNHSSPSSPTTSNPSNKATPRATPRTRRTRCYSINKAKGNESRAREHSDFCGFLWGCFWCRGCIINFICTILIILSTLAWRSPMGLGGVREMTKLLRMLPNKTKSARHQIYFSCHYLMSLQDPKVISMSVCNNPNQNNNW